ncbi:N-acetyltransferase [Paenibacillus sp. GD4]|uniref:GNAT family N-acetyltransferase n=1 Tax=Paenibacillus sp. GD4 TaxID=3068890 RepID=UPI002796D3B5|nr:N-acetyltransferase [Paenibacillus sp. GD4]MDQ1914844.1 N-acetyltransferase [Paenibacillus sp. GD4]
MNFFIRQEMPDDYEQTEIVVESAFAAAQHSDGNEHKLVSRLRKSDSFIPELSLVAVHKETGQVAGHILLSKISINVGNQAVESLALAPLSVLPAYQNKGVGKQLIQEALAEAKRLGYHSVVVLGHSAYYPRFGFKKASIWGIKAPFEVPDEVFMAIELHEAALAQVSGVVEYPSVFFMNG